jgi:hypothetical protein
MQCPNCKTEREPRDFKRFATLAQTRAWIKKPDAQKRMIYVGSICNACHRQVMRKPNEISPAELRKRLINEGKSTLIVDSLHESRVQYGKVKLRAGALRALKLQRKDLFVPVVADLNKLINTIKRKRAYIYKTDKDMLALRFLDTCLAQALIARGKVLAKKKAAGKPPDNWRALIDEDYDFERDNAYAYLSTTYKDRCYDIQQKFKK